MTKVSSLAEAKAHLSELVARVADQHERITVTVHGRPAAVLLAVDDLQSDSRKPLQCCPTRRRSVPLARPMLS